MPCMYAANPKGCFNQADGVKMKSPRDGMADKRDLKSLGGKPPCGFESRRGHQQEELMAYVSEIVEWMKLADPMKVPYCTGPGPGATVISIRDYYINLIQGIDICQKQGVDPVPAMREQREKTR